MLQLRLPYVFIRGGKIYYRRYVPTRLRSTMGKTEIKISLGPVSCLTELMPILTRLSITPPELINDMLIPKMSPATWDSIASTLLNDPPDTIRNSHRPILQAISKHLGKVDDSPALSEVIKKYLVLKNKSKISYSAKKGISLSVNEFLTIIGDKKISDIDKNDIKQYRDILCGDPNMSAATKKNKLMYTHNFLKWCKVETNISDFSDIFDNIDLKQYDSTPGVGKGKMISDKDYHIIQNFLEKWKDTNYAWRYWIYQLLMYTGARAGEICGLMVDDIVDIDDIPCIWIRPGERSLKNKASERVIPIHPELINTGFLVYVKSRQGEKQLFEIKPHLTGWAHYVSRWYRDNLDKAGASVKWTSKDSRSTVESKFYLLPLSEHERRIALRITGRAVTVTGVNQSVITVQTKHYVNKDYSPIDMLPVISQIRYQPDH